MMPPAARSVALLGNPNTGKTTVFNRLTGYRARTGNYAGVTVEHKVGRLRDAPAGRTVHLVDLPGTYSLSVRSEDERVAVDVLLGRTPEEPAPDALLVVLDATNLERNLYLVSQLLDLGRPLALVLNMMDAARAKGIAIEADALAAALCIPVFPAVARSGEGFDAITAWVAGSPAPDDAPPPAAAVRTPFPPEVEAAADALAARLDAAGHHTDAACPAFLARRLLLDHAAAPADLLHGADDGLAADVTAARAALEAAGHRLATLEARTRYAWIRERLAGVVTAAATSTGAATPAPGAAPRDPAAPSRSERLDALLLHRVAGPLLLALLALLVFQAIYAWSAPAMDAIDGAFASLAGALRALLPDGPLADLLADGVVAGVGGVLVFLPQIVVLFFFIALLEDCGYMARAAFLMDRFFSRVGLTGRSFIPMLSSFACAIPGIMATRTISDPKDRLVTILVAPLMSCSARLPVYTVLIGAFVPATPLVPGLLGMQGATLFAMYLVGIVVAVPVALLLRRTILRGEPAPFLMELPDYRLPHWPTVLHRVGERAWAFVVRAGTLILAVAILVWAAAYFPRHSATALPPPTPTQQAMTEFSFGDKARELASRVERPPGTTMADTVRALPPDAIAADPIVAEFAALLDALDAEEEERAAAEAGEQVRQSYLGRAGRLIEPLVEPLGWDWRIGMAVVASFPAREVVIATLGIIFDVGDADEESLDLRGRLQDATRPDGTPLFSLPVALSIMVFFALCAQCAATLVIIRRETNSWKWAAFAFAYMTALAYVGALLTFHAARFLLG